MSYRVVDVMKKKNYILISLLSAILTVILYLGLQSVIISGWHNMDLWLQVMPWYNIVLTIVFALSFGVLVALQVYNYCHKICSLKKSSASSGFGAALAFIVPACPACASLPALLLPATLATSAVGVLVKFSPLLLVISILLVVLGIHLQRGFER